MLRAPALALFALAGIFALTDGARAETSFDPYFEVAASGEPQAPTELTIKFGLRNSLDSQFSVVRFYFPRDWGVASGDKIPVGMKVGAVGSIETLGLINSACNNAILLTFELLNASVDASQTVSFDDTDETEARSTISPVEPGHAAGDYWLAEENSGAGIQDFAEDKDGNGLLDAIDRYPDFLDKVFGDARPVSRLAGVSVVAGMPVLLQLLTFPPATRLDLPGQSSPDFDESGYPAVMVTQDLRNLDEAHQPSPITDHCGPRTIELSFFPSTNAPPVFVNPQSGSYVFTLAATSKRDADGDGIVNGLDTCAFVTNFGSPTISANGDEDQDGMDAACDPNHYLPEGGTNSDEDGDGYLNRQDNCPLVVNGEDAPTPPGNQSDQDFDDIGDACDPNPNSPDGEALVVTRTAEVVVGDRFGSGGPPMLDACSQCYRPDAPPAEAEGDGSGGQLAVALGLIAVGAGTGAVLVGSGAAYLIRRRRV